MFAIESCPLLNVAVVIFTFIFTLCFTLELFTEVTLLMITPQKERKAKLSVLH